MEEYIIPVNKIEELQMLNDKDALDAIFTKKILLGIADSIGVKL